MRRVDRRVRREVAKNLHRKMRFWVSVWQVPIWGRRFGYLLGPANINAILP